MTLATTTQRNIARFLAVHLFATLSDSAHTITSYRSVLIDDWVRSAKVKVTKQTQSLTECAAFARGVDANSGFWHDGGGECSVLDVAGEAHYIRCFRVNPGTEPVAEFYVPRERLDPGKG